MKKIIIVSIHSGFANVPNDDYIYGYDNGEKVCLNDCLADVYRIEVPDDWSIQETIFGEKYLVKDGEREWIYPIINEKSISFWAGFHVIYNVKI